MIIESDSCLDFNPNNITSNPRVNSQNTKPPKNETKTPTQLEYKKICDRNIRGELDVKVTL
jgi:hypothetical protein